MWAREAVQGLEPGSPAEAGAGRDRPSDRDFTLGWVREYESAVCKVKKEILVQARPRRAVFHREGLVKKFDSFHGARFHAMGLARLRGVRAAAKTDSQRRGSMPFFTPP